MNIISRRKYVYRNLIGFYLLFNFFITNQKIYSAENINFASGPFSRTIKIKTIEEFAKTGKTNKKLMNLIKMSREKPETISILLNQNFEMPLLLTSRLLNSRIGEVMLDRIGKIIYPLRVKKRSVSVPAIRAGLIKGVYLGKGKINMVEFLKSYPNKTITINVTALSKILSKVETINDLIKFFSNSPLESLKTRQR